MYVELLVGNESGTKVYQPVVQEGIESVSYTHLDVYKRQVPRLGAIMAGHKSCGMEGTFSGTAHYNQSVLRQARCV